MYSTENLRLNVLIIRLLHHRPNVFTFLYTVFWIFIRINERDLKGKRVSLIRLRHLHDNWICRDLLKNDLLMP